MVDIRRIVIIFVIGVLFAVLVFSTIEAAYPRPRYEEFCRQDAKPRAPLMERRDCPSFAAPDDVFLDCSNQGGVIIYEYGPDGCASSFRCDTCQSEYDAARDFHKMIVFIVSAILSLLAIAIALYLPLSNELNEWVGTGFMLGGLFSLFFGTAQYFDSMSRFLRPVVILIELCIVIYLTYKKLSVPEPETLQRNKKNKKR